MLWLTVDWLDQQFSTLVGQEIPYNYGEVTIFCVYMYVTGQKWKLQVKTFYPWLILNFFSLLALINHASFMELWNYVGVALSMELKKPKTHLHKSPLCRNVLFKLVQNISSFFYDAIDFSLS